MAYSRFERKNSTPHRKELLGVLYLSLGFFLFLALLSYTPTDPSLNSASNVATISNLGGIIGSYLADFLFTTFGLCAYLISFLAVFSAMLKFRGQTLDIQWKESLWYFLLLLLSASFLQLHFPQVVIAKQGFAGGGVLGTFLSGFLVHYLNRVGAEVIILTGMLLSFILATHLKISVMAINTYRLLRYFGSLLTQWSRVSFERGKKGCLAFGGWLKNQWLSIFVKEEKNEPVKIHKPRQALALVKPTSEALEDFEKPKPETGTPFDKAEPKIFERVDADKKAKEESQLQFLKWSADAYSIPPLSLLDADKQHHDPVDEEALKKSAHLLEKKLLDYEVQGKITEIHPGPVITMYEFEPATGTKVSKIVGLESDLSLVMGGKAIRVVGHLPGKAAVGIEIPNYQREIVWLKDIIGSTAFQKTKSHLTLSLGKDIKGRPLVADLTKMPHLLIAGATGAGKSVGINSMIMSMLYKASPKEVRFIFVDPKRLELSVYENIPHLLLPVVTEPKKAVVALRWAVKEMERRYRLLADVGCRNIETYNERVGSGDIALISEEEAQGRIEKDKEAICHTEKLYYLVIIIDELADLMMVASQEFEDTVTRLAQMARAAGIHLILATQRPSVDIITGLIKANFPARISYKVSSKHDSRTILDQIGSENLLGSGDMLFMAPSSSNLIRIHGAYVTEAEIARVVGHLRGFGSPIFNEAILEASLEKTDEEGLEFDEEDTEIYDKAVRIVAETRQASISMIQRRLRIGYNRAARMVERMEQQGVIGPQDGIKPRQILINDLENP